MVRIPQDGAIVRLRDDAQEPLPRELHPVRIVAKDDVFQQLAGKVQLTIGGSGRKDKKKEKSENENVSHERALWTARCAFVLRIA
jgi:hypothetical protein